jgi:hypothetical protein
MFSRNRNGICWAEAIAGADSQPFGPVEASSTTALIA